MIYMKVGIILNAWYIEIINKKNNLKNYLKNYFNLLPYRINIYKLEDHFRVQNPKLIINKPREK